MSMHLCGDSVHGWFCTRERGHADEHIATIGRHEPDSVDRGVQLILSRRRQDEPNRTPAPLPSAEPTQTKASGDCGYQDVGSAEELSSLRTALTAEIQARQEAEKDNRELRGVLERNGYRRCDIMACNCNGWHSGHSAQRLAEIGDALTDAGIDLNGKTLLEGIRELTTEREARQQAERERDLARAHDVQPYPTADAYEAVCATLNRTKDALTASERARATLRTALAGLVACCTTADSAIGPEPADRGVWLRGMLEARAALSSSLDPRVTKTDDQGSR